MKKHINIKKVYLLTFIFFIAAFLFLYAFTEKAERFYTGWDSYTNENTLSIFADVS
jgi:high-affinity Fe2+/Pb2+ permease